MDILIQIYEPFLPEFGTEVCLKIDFGVSFEVVWKVTSKNFIIFVKNIWWEIEQSYSLNLLFSWKLKLLNIWLNN